MDTHAFHASQANGWPCRWHGAFLHNKSTPGAMTKNQRRMNKLEGTKTRCLPTTHDISLNISSMNT
ncbi:MAG: hypothetical protein ABW069_09345 [Duganella sp.]